VFQPFKYYADAIAELPRVDLEQRHLLRRAFLIGTEGQLSVFYAPVDHVNSRAKIVLLGLCPGWHQMQLAFQACRDSLLEGSSDRKACIEAKRIGAFAGMRPRIATWLDQLGVNDWLGIASSDQLFGHEGELLHATSAIRYPVFVGPQHANYTGYRPKPERSELLTKVVHDLLITELKKLPEALVVPFGNVVSGVIEQLPGIDLERCLIGFPHPSGANGHAPVQFAREMRQMKRRVQALR
jgi:hypothetical protein